jgi:NAD(P)-dependent dehydrogenase (short-subunit alcohol dehydrogenase family)
VAKAFAAQRAKVFLHYFRSKDSNDEVLGNISSPGEGFYNSQQTKSPDEVLKAIRDLGIEAHAWEADLSDAAVVPELFNQVEKAPGPMEGIVNNEEYWEGDTFLPAGADLTNKLNELWTDRLCGQL